MYRYAQLDADGFLVSVLTYSSPIEDSLYIEIEDDSVFKDFYKPKYENGQWIEGATPEEIEEIEKPKNLLDRVEELENENADLWYEIMLKDARIKEHDNEIADIWYEIMLGGV